MLLATASVLASVTDSLITFATDKIGDLGLPAVFLLVAVDALGIPIAAGVILMFAGFEVDRGHMTLLGVILAGTLGDLVGACIAYAIGYFGRAELLEKHGGKIHMTPERLALVDRAFARFGDWIIPIGRILPFVRTYVSYPAGAARMPFGRFATLTAIGALVLSIVFTLIGKHVGAGWEDWKHNLQYVDYAVIALIILGIAYLVVRRVRGGGGTPGGTPDAAA